LPGSQQGRKHSPVFRRRVRCAIIGRLSNAVKRNRNLADRWIRYRVRRLIS
jgi:hypothetical protein